MLLQRGANAETDVKGGEHSKKQFALLVIFEYSSVIICF